MRAAKIRINHKSPEMRKKYSDIRREQWKDKEFRKKTIAGIQKSKRSPEAKAKFSKLLRERWQDPVWREKWTKANKAKNTDALRRHA